MIETHEGLLPEFKAKDFVLDPEFLYKEIEVSPLRKQQFIDVAKGIQNGSIEREDPRVKSMAAFVELMESLEKDGWEMFEISHDAKSPMERRRFRKKP